MLIFLLSIMYLGGVFISSFLLALAGGNGYLFTRMFLSLTWPIWWCILLSCSTIVLVCFGIYSLVKVLGGK